MGNVILGLLLMGPATLYAINKHFEQGISLFYSASLGSLRTALLRLNDRRLIKGVDSVENGRNKRTYSITDTGRQAFSDWMYSPILTRDVETTALSKLFFLGWLDDGPERSRVLADIVQRISADEKKLVDLGDHLDVIGAGIPEIRGDVFRYQRMTLEYGIGAHRLGREFFTRLAASESP